MITQEDLDAMGFSYYEDTGQQARVRCMTPMSMVQEFSEKTEQEPNAKLYFKLISEEYREWLDEKAGTTKELKELADLVYVVFGYANAMGYDLDEALRRVHANNVGRCLQPDGTVKRREDGKILKQPNYPKPYLDDLIK